LRLTILSGILVLLSTIGTAFSSDDFSVNIKADAEDLDSAAAQQKALNEASRSAVITAVNRIADQAAVDRFMEMNDNQIVNFIKDTSVSDEKTYGNHYTANLKLTVNMDLLRTYMNERQIDYSTAITPSVMIIPVFSEFSGDTPKLWELDNPWRMAWNDFPQSTVVNIKLIADSPANAALLSAKQALDVDEVPLNELKSEYNVDDIYILSASYNGIDGLNIAVSNLSGFHDTINIEGVKSSGDELFTKAVNETILLIEEQTLQQNSPHADNEITVLFPFTELGDWVSAEQQIKSLDMVSAIEIQAFSPGKSQFIVRYRGDKSALLRAFQNAGYNLEESGNYMILSYIGD